jgi:hypothetical protein
VSFICNQFLQKEFSSCQGAINIPQWQNRYRFGDDARWWTKGRQRRCQVEDGSARTGVAQRKEGMLSSSSVRPSTNKPVASKREHAPRTIGSFFFSLFFPFLSFPFLSCPFLFFFGSFLFGSFLFFFLVFLVLSVFLTGFPIRHLPHSPPSLAAFDHPACTSLAGDEEGIFPHPCYHHRSPLIPREGSKISGRSPLKGPSLKDLLNLTPARSKTRVLPHTIFPHTRRHSSLSLHVLPVLRSPFRCAP